jgi:hypothetical protein
MISAYKLYRQPLQRGDGRWLVSDLYAAAYLVACGNEVVEIEPTAQSGRFAFVIEPGLRFQDDYEAFASNAPIRVRDFIDAAYLLKGMLRSGGFQGEK